MSICSVDMRGKIVLMHWLVTTLFVWKIWKDGWIHKIVSCEKTFSRAWDFSLGLKFILQRENNLTYEAKKITGVESGDLCDLSLDLNWAEHIW